MLEELIRKRIEKAKKDAEGILKDTETKKKTPKEYVIVIRSILSLLEIIVAVLLEEKTRKNSSKSGRSAPIK